MDYLDWPCGRTPQQQNAVTGVQVGYEGQVTFALLSDGAVWSSTACMDYAIQKQFQAVGTFQICKTGKKDLGKGIQVIPSRFKGDCQ